MPTSTSTSKIEDYSRQLWQVMHDGAVRNNMAKIRDPKLGEGRVIINTIGAFFKVLNNERNWGVDERTKKVIYTYLKTSGNVVILTKIADYHFRIFISETYNEKPALKKDTKPHSEGDAIAKRAERLQPHEVGEDLPPSDVHYICGKDGCRKSYPTQDQLNGHLGQHAKAEKKATMNSHRKQITRPRPMNPPSSKLLLSEQSAAILKVLYDQGGTVREPTGRVSGLIANQDSRIGSRPSHSLQTLDKRGLIKRDMNGKRTFSISLTEEGLAIAENLDQHRISRYVVSDFLAERKDFRAPKKELTRRIADQLGVDRGLVLSSLRTLEDEGLVKAYRNNPQGLPYRVKWLGEETASSTPSSSDMEEATASLVSESKETDSNELSNDALLTELALRLEQDRSSSRTSELEATLSSISSVVSEVNQGSLSPLRALADIDGLLRENSNQAR